MRHNFNILKICLSSLALIALLFSTGTNSEKQSYGQDFRTWNSNTDKYSVDASLVSLNSNAVELLRKDGRTISVPLSKLSLADQEFLSNHQIKRFPKTLFGKVISVADGDTLTILDGQNQKHRIRFEGIDAPEKKQEYSAKSKKVVSDLVFGKVVRVQWNEKDRYQRILGHIYLGDYWLNLAQVENGWAWHYKKYSDDELLAEAEIEARKEKRGLWADSSEPIPPWDFRNLPRKSETARASPSDIPSSSFDKEEKPLSYWLNTSSNVRHNRSCRWYRKTKRGRECNADEGKPCGQCGG